MMIITDRTKTVLYPTTTTATTIMNNLKKIRTILSKITLSTSVKGKKDQL